MKPTHSQILQARDEYNNLAEVVEANGYGDLIRRHCINDNASREQIRQATTALRQTWREAIRNNPYVMEED